MTQPSPSTPAPEPRPSGVQSTPAAAPAPRPASIAVQIVDQLADIAGVVCLTLLCLRGRLTGELAAGAILLVLGVQTGLRRLGTAGLGAAGLALVALGPGVLAAARATTARLGMLAVLACLGCSPARDALTASVPGAPPAVGCILGTSRCAGGMPEVCSSSGRWWPALPGPCPGGCVIEDAGARCSAAGDGGAP